MGIHNPERVEIRDEGVVKGRVKTIDLVGAGVGATVTGGVATVTIPGGGGGGGASATTIEQNLGSTWEWQGRFTIVDAGISPTSKVLCWQAPGPYTGKGARADAAAMEPVQVIAVEPASGSATVYWQTPPIVTMSLFHTTIGGLKEKKDTNAPAGTGQIYFDRYVGYQQVPKRLGKVKGNIKFSYVIFA